MPIYEYKCPKCYKEMELTQKFNDPAPLCCCDEGAPVEMVKQISKSSFVLKGKGWYKTDYGGK